MRELRTEIEIAATPDRVWEVLSDLTAYPDWNPFIKEASGKLETEAKLEVYFQLSGGKGMGLKPTVLRADPGQEIRWLARVFVPGIFDGEHYFIIERQREGGVRFVQGERFMGILVSFFGGTQKDAERGFQEMNQALKEPGFFAQGETYEDARSNLEEVIEGNVLLAFQLGWDAPPIPDVAIREERINGTI